MYQQYTTEHETGYGKLKIERTYKVDQDNKSMLDSVVVSVAGRVIELPRSAHQTDRTIVRKVLGMLKLFHL